MGWRGHRRVMQGQGQRWARRPPASVSTRPCLAPRGVPLTCGRRPRGRGWGGRAWAASTFHCFRQLAKAAPRSVQRDWYSGCDTTCGMGPARACEGVSFHLASACLGATRSRGSGPQPSLALEAGQLRATWALAGPPLPARGRPSPWRGGGHLLSDAAHHVLRPELGHARLELAPRPGRGRLDLLACEVAQPCIDSLVPASRTSCGHSAATGGSPC